MASSISSKLIPCLRSFNALLTHPELAAHEAEVPHAAWQDELGRLRIWAANIGAHQTGQSSLDYRLRDASHISQQISKLLEDLCFNLREIEEILADDPLLGQESDGEEETEIQQLFHELSNIIKCLYQMSMLIRKPARHDRLRHSHMDDAKAYQPFDRDHVAHKYPEADSATVERLGLAISRRRVDLRYRERHHAKLSQGIEHAHDDTKPETTSVVLSQTIATDYRENTYINLDDAASTSGLSQTSYAPSLVGGGANCVPPLPKEAAGEQPFQCPCCYFLITIKNERSWTRHVFKDIMPYICVYPNCSTPNKLYESRHEWFDHEVKVHLKPKTASDATFEIGCPLCNSVKSVAQLERHLARHLEELALFALPRAFSGENEEFDKSRNSPFHVDLAQEVFSRISESIDPRDTSSRDEPKFEPLTSGSLTSYFFRGEGISREVVEADICRYLGPDALCRAYRDSTVGRRCSHCVATMKC